MQLESFETFTKVNSLCKQITEDTSKVSLLKELKSLIEKSGPNFARCVQKQLLAVIYVYMKEISGNHAKFKSDEKQIIVETLKCTLDKIIIETPVLFFNFYSFLLLQIYDYNEHKVTSISEEYKLIILECISSLAKSISSDEVAKVYIKENAPKFSQIIYVAGEIAKNEKSRELRCSAIRCLMCIARVNDDDDLNDVVLRDQIAEIFIFFLPGISNTLAEIVLEDQKTGHRVIQEGLKAFGRLLTLILQDYRKTSDTAFDLKQLLLQTKNLDTTVPKQKFKTKEQIDNYIVTTKRTPEWYKDNDKKLCPLLAKLGKLTHYPHVKVRKQLVEMISLVITSCITTIPLCVTNLIEISIVLCEDEDEIISQRSKQIIEELSKKLSQHSLRDLLENMQDGFLIAIENLPTQFNSVDEKEKVMALNLLIGYITLFGKHNLNHILLVSTHLNNIMSTLLRVAELKTGNISLLEEYGNKDLDGSLSKKEQWKNFQYFREEEVKLKLEKLCFTLAKLGTFPIFQDYLLDILMSDEEHRKEAIFLLNEAVQGVDANEKNLQIIKNIILTYMEDNIWKVPLIATDKVTLLEAKNNLIQACLLVEGIGKIALSCKDKFQQFLLRILYLVIERAGSGIPLLREAGLNALQNITYAMGYNSIADLINNNIDYFSFHVERNLNRLEENPNVLDVFSVVLSYSKMDVFQSIDSVINEVLMHSCDRFNHKNINSFLRIFKMFLERLRDWLDIKVEECLQTKAERIKEEEEPYKITGINYEEKFSDDIMEGKTAEELWKEDMEKKEKAVDEEDEVNENEGVGLHEVKKPDPPPHIKLVIAILSRSLHFLPSPDKTRKLLVLEILNSGVEILRDFEDDLLPIVHKIWSPLVNRFSEFDQPVIINYSFQLLLTLARLSRDFIRMRTTKEALPNILLVLTRLSKESYLKDRGSAYRYTQAYKLQLEILNNLGKLLVYLDVLEKHFDESMDCVFLYLSDKQPIPLQTNALEFFKTVCFYDKGIVKKKINSYGEMEAEYQKNIEKISKMIL